MDLQTDLQRAPTVICLEGKTDEELFFALAGVPRPSSAIHKKAYVVGRKTRGQGGNEVRALLQEAEPRGEGEPASRDCFARLKTVSRKASRGDGWNWRRASSIALNKMRASGVAAP